MVSTTRATKIAERIREELSEVLVMNIQDPRLSGVSITDIRVDRELAFADVYFSCVEGERRAAEILQGFQHAQGYLRSELARRVDLRYFPRLRFHYDPTFERAERVEYLLAEIRRENEDKEQDANTGDN